jgi:hypothetical protein
MEHALQGPNRLNTVQSQAELESEAVIEGLGTQTAVCAFCFSQYRLDDGREGDRFCCDQCVRDYYDDGYPYNPEAGAEYNDGEEG